MNQKFWDQLLAIVSNNFGIKKVPFRVTCTFVSPEEFPTCAVSKV